MLSFFIFSVLPIFLTHSLFPFLLTPLASLHTSLRPVSWHVTRWQSTTWGVAWRRGCGLALSDCSKTTPQKQTTVAWWRRSIGSEHILQRVLLLFLIGCKRIEKKRKKHKTAQGFQAEEDGDLRRVPQSSQTIFFGICAWMCAALYICLEEKSKYFKEQESGIFLGTCSVLTVMWINRGMWRRVCKAAGILWRWGFLRFSRYYKEMPWDF